MPRSHTPPRQLTARTLSLATDELADRDPDLRAIVGRIGPPPLWARRPGFATLLRIILEQQVSLASAQTMFERLRLALGAVTPEAVSSLDVGGLRALGFTRQKAGYCHGLAEGICSGRLDLGAIGRMTGDGGVKKLLEVRGLGPWSVDIYFLIALRRPDVWPRGDVALATAVHHVKRLRTRPDDARLARVAKQWAPWRSVAARILWHQYLSVRMRRKRPPAQRGSGQ
jgi:DNA-3-methyladenine glycosylase II